MKNPNQRTNNGCWNCRYSETYYLDPRQMPPILCCEHDFSEWPKVRAHCVTELEKWDEQMAARAKCTLDHKVCGYEICDYWEKP